MLKKRNRLHQIYCVCSQNKGFWFAFACGWRPMEYKRTCPALVRIVDYFILHVFVRRIGSGLSSMVEYAYRHAGVSPSQKNPVQQKAYCLLLNRLLVDHFFAALSAALEDVYAAAGEYPPTSCKCLVILFLLGRCRLSDAGQTIKRLLQQWLQSLLMPRERQDFQQRQR